MTAMITAEHLTRKFQRSRDETPITAVDDLSLEISQGEVFGFLGPNGAGKTTTVRMLTSLISPTAGRAFVNGFQTGKQDMEIRQTVGILTEIPGMYERLSAEKNLSIYARLYGVKNPAGQVEKYLRLLGLWDRRFDEVGGFSKGMKQKLAIARALLHEPRILYLDEPTSGLDPEAAKLVRNFISDLKDSGVTVFLCTHNLDEADRLCQRIAIFKNRLIALDTPGNLRRAVFGRKVVFHLKKLESIWMEKVRQLPFVHSVRTVDERMVVELEKPEENNPNIVRLLVESGAEIQFVGELRYSLEDIYLQVVNH